MTNSIIDAMSTAGIICKEAIITDGKLHRFSADGKGNKNGWYVAFEHGGAFGDWSQEISEKWSADNHKMTPEQRRIMQAQIREAKAERKQELIKQYEEAAHNALTRWQSYSDTGQSPYLEKKQVQAYGVRYYNDTIVIPIMDIEGNLWSMQYVTKEGRKQFFTGGKKKGNFHSIGLEGELDKIYICEGYATGASIFEAIGKPVVIAFDAGNIEPVTNAIKLKYPNASIILCGDNDQWKEHNTGKETVEAVAKQYGCKAILPKFIDDSLQRKPTDFNDLHVLEGLEAVKKQLPNDNIIVEKTSGLKAINIQDFLSMDIKPQELIMQPIIPKQGVCMLYAFRGIGKTHVALGIAYAVATGGQFLKWQASKARKILYIDGEMPAISMQERLAREVSGSDLQPPTPDYFRLLTPDMQELGIPSLTDKAGQAALEPLLDGVELVILDNISTLCRGGRENESESWSPVQEWALQLRKRGVTTLFIHHAGKNNQQRGASKREDIMDTVISLKRPEDYETSQGARFEVHYEKSRGFTGDDAAPFEAWLKQENNKSVWQCTELEDKELAMAIMLKAEGYKQREIAQHIGCSAAKVNRLLKKAKQEQL